MSSQLGRKVDQVLHEEAHGPSGCRRDLGHSALVKLKVDVLGPGKAWSPFLNPRQRSKRTQVKSTFKTLKFNLLPLLEKEMGLWAQPGKRETIPLINKAFYSINLLPFRPCVIFYAFLVVQFRFPF